MSVDTIREAAREYHEAGINVAPLREQSKKPLGEWKPWQRQLQTDHDLDILFPDDRRNIGAIGGEVSNNLVFLDFDSRTAYRDALDHAPGFARVAMATPNTRTARGAHVWLRTPEPVQTGKIKVRGQELGDIKGSRSYVVAPPSLHPSSQLYMFETGWKPIYELQSLDELGFITLEPETASPDSRVMGIRFEMFQILRGEVPFKYSSRSEADAALMLTLVKDRWSWDRVSELWRRFASETTKYGSKPARERMGYLRRTYENALAYFEANKRDLDRQIDQVLSSLHSLPLEGRSKHTDREVLRATLLLARRSGKTVELGLSAREIAEMAGISYQTAARALQRLPWINLAIPSQHFHEAARYTLDIGAMGKICHTETFLQHPTCEGVSHYDNCASDAFHRDALGKTGAALLGALASAKGQWFTAAEIADRAGVHERTAYRKLQDLERFGLLSTQGDYGKRYTMIAEPTEEDLIEIAKVKRTYGAGARQKQRHKEERAQYAELVRRGHADKEGNDAATDE